MRARSVISLNSFSDAPRLATRYGATIQPIGYAGFWIRLIASLLDEAITYFPVMWLGQFALPELLRAFDVSLGENSQQFLLLGFSVIALIPYDVAFHYYCGWTPGKWAMRIVVRDAKTHGRSTLSWKQCFLRWVGEIVSILPFGFGYFMVARDPEKRGWHDLIAGTICYRYRR